MKKILLMVCVLFITCCGKPNEFDDKKIYFFYSNGCPHCHDALAFIDKKYPALDIAMVNVTNQSGFSLLVDAAKKYKLGNAIGTPLITFNDKYIMGWGQNSAKEFDKYVKPYLNK